MRTLCVVTVAVLIGCSASPPRPVDPAKKGSAGWPDESGGVMDACAKACRTLWQYDCPEATPKKSKMNCTVLCRDRPMLFEADCVANVQSKSELSTCNVRCLSE
jgi:hypothetical protein